MGVGVIGVEVRFQEGVFLMSFCCLLIFFLFFVLMLGGRRGGMGGSCERKEERLMAVDWREST